MRRKRHWLLLPLLLLATAAQATSRHIAPKPSCKSTTTLRAEIANFLDQEMAAHLKAVGPLEPPPEQVYGAGATGEYTWGTFMRAVAAYAEMSKQQAMGGRDLARLVAEVGLLEQRLG